MSAPDGMPTAQPALPAATIVEGSTAPTPSPAPAAPAASLPFGLTPAAPKLPKYRVIDLGDYDPDWAGYQVVIDTDLPMEIEEVAKRATDETLPDEVRREANYRFLELVLLAWNFTEQDPLTGATILLPQPRQGGVRRLKASQTPSLIKAFNTAYGAPPNS